MSEKMEQWEIDLRARLEKELPEGGYEIGGPKIEGERQLIAWTGKQGKINYEVEFERECKRLGYIK